MGLRLNGRSGWGEVLGGRKVEIVPGVGGGKVACIAVWVGAAPG